VRELEENKNIVLSGKWDSADKDKPTGGCHLNDKEYMEDENKCTWSSNPQFLLKLSTKGEMLVRITLSRPERDKQWKEQIGKDLVGCMIGFYVSKENLINKATQKFVPWNEVSEELQLEGITEGHVIMPTTNEPNKFGPFIIAVSTDVEFTLVPLE